jgi:hypothetical protein
MHAVLERYDTEGREHPEEYAHYLTGMVLRENIRNKDPAVRDLARKGYAAYVERHAGSDADKTGASWRERFQESGRREGKEDVGDVLIDGVFGVLRPADDFLKNYFGYSPFDYLSTLSKTVYRAARDNLEEARKKSGS